MTSNDELVALILPWAKLNLPEAYGKTLAVATNPSAFRKYLLRLIEIRCAKEKEFRRDIQLSTLEETSLRFKMRHAASGIEIEVAGVRATGSRSWGFAELAMLYESGASAADLIQLNEFKLGLDLELVATPRSNNATVTTGND